MKTGLMFLLALTMGQAMAQEVALAGGSTVERKGFGLEDVHVFPNPATTQFRVSFNTQGTQAFRISIFDLIGQEVQSSTYMRASGSYFRDFDTSDWHPGVYLMRISCNDHTKTLRVVVRR